MIKNEKKAKEREKKEIEAMNRKHLSNMRVVQKSLVYVIGLPTKLANDEVNPTGITFMGPCATFGHEDTAYNRTATDTALFVLPVSYLTP